MWYGKVVNNKSPSTFSSRCMLLWAVFCMGSVVEKQKCSQYFREIGYRHQRFHRNPSTFKPSCKYSITLPWKFCLISQCKSSQIQNYVLILSYTNNRFKSLDTINLKLHNVVIHQIFLIHFCAIWLGWVWKIQTPRNCEEQNTHEILYSQNYTVYHKSVFFLLSSIGKMGKMLCWFATFS